MAADAQKPEQMMFRSSFLIFVCLPWSSAWSSGWTPSGYPNPNISPGACGRPGVRQSWLCDPDRILRRESQDVIEGITKAISLGEDPYVRAPCGSKGEVGFQVGVAVMRSFQTVGDEDKAAVAERFARALHDDWGVGDKECNNGILLFLSIDDRQIFISTGAGSKNWLRDGLIDTIIASVKPLLRSQRYDAAVERAVLDIGLALAGKIQMTDKVQGEGSWVALVIFFSIIGLFVWLVVWAIKSGTRQQATYNDCRAKLEKLKRDQERLASGQSYNPVSCPICFEDFDPATGQQREVPNVGPDPSPASTSPYSSLRQRVRSVDRRANGVGGEAPSPATPSAPAAPQDYVHPEPRVARNNEPHVPRRPLVLPCKHTFCEACITSWVVDQRKVTCPVCRTHIDDEAPPNTTRYPPPPPCNATFGQTGTRQYDPFRQDPYNQDPYRPNPFLQDPNHLTWFPGYGGSGYPNRYRQGPYAHQDMFRDELLFRSMGLRRRYPQYVDDHMLRTMNADINAGRPISAEAWRNFQLRDPAARAAAARSGSHGSHSNFGGGSSKGGGGRGSSW